MTDKNSSDQIVSNQAPDQTKFGLENSLSPSLLNGVASILAEKGSQYLSSSTNSVITPIGKMIDELDVLLKDQFIFGVFNEEYADIKKRKYSELRQSGLLPSLQANSLRTNPQHRIHFPLFENICLIFDKLVAIQKNENKLSEQEQIKQLIAVLESIQIEKDQERFNELYARERVENKEKRIIERQTLLTSISVYKANSLNALAANKTAPVVVTKTSNVVQANIPSSTQQVVAKQVNIEVKQAIRTSLLQEPAVNVARIHIAHDLENAKNKINEYWQVLIKKNHAPENIFKNVIGTVISALDEFIKDKFLLEAFASDFNTAFRTKHEAADNKPKTTYEQDFRARGEKTNFSYFKNRFFTKETFAYLMAAYPNDFLAFRQMVNLLEEITSIQANSALTQKEILRQIFACLGRFGKFDWVIDVDVKKDLTENSRLGNSVLKFSDIERREKAGVDVIYYMSTFLRKLNAKLVAEYKAAETSQSASVIETKVTPIQIHAPLNESAPVQFNKPQAQHSQKLFTPSASSVVAKPQTQPKVQETSKKEIKSQQKRVNSGDDLLGQVANISYQATTVISNAQSTLSQWASKWWNGGAKSQTQTPKQDAPKFGF